MTGSRNWKALASHPLALICLVAFALRLASAYLLPNITHPDETFQYGEQAYRAVTGRGLVPWEYAVGARSWLLAGMQIPVVATVRLVAHDPALLRLALAAAMSLFALASVWASYRIGRDLGGSREAAILSALLAAFWCEFVYFSPHFLADTVSAVFLLLGVAFAVGWRRAVERSDLKPAPRKLLAAGIMLGFAVAFRPQLGPAAIILGLWTVGVRPTARWLWLLVGGLVPILAMGAVDWISWGSPFHSVFTYVRANSGGIANIFGVEPGHYYLARELAVWGVATPLIVGTAILGARRAAILAILSLTIFITFSAVPHKEWRFVYPALPPLFCLCAIGSAEVLAIVRRRLPAVKGAAILGAIILAWLALSLLSGVRGAMRPVWMQGSESILALEQASRDPKACGLGVEPPDRWMRTGLSRLRSDIGLYPARSGQDGLYNYAISFEASRSRFARGDAGFVEVGCYRAGTCLYRRPGGCTGQGPPLRADPEPAVRDMLDRLGLHAIDRPAR
ncbi:glycosyltransferase family protein [Rhizorhabdus sp. FW153]|uniref:hypothetical protein n=1 Tax=Rhizorhabdus sp. FW153 TaxID=3400216 RepID=UPI003CE81099